jgi:RHS repeat-associated protein
MTIYRWVVTLGGYSTIRNKYKAILVVQELMFGKAGAVMNTSQETCTSCPLTRAVWSTFARLGCFGTILGLLSCSLYAQTNFSGAYERAITIDHTKVPNTDQTSFPVLISGTYPFLATTQYNGRLLNANGYDIIFTSDAAGQHVLPFEIDTYNPATGSASFWVGVPTLSHTTDTTIYMFYGIPNITSSQENKAGVWSNGYLSVYHLGNGTTVGLADSGRAGYTLAGSPPAGTGVIGGGAVFNGNPGTYLYHDSVPAYPSGSSPVTVEAWARQAAPQSPDFGGGEIVGYGDNSAAGARTGIQLLPSSWYMEFENMAVTGGQSFDNNWHHFVGVYGGGTLSTTTDQIYLDGVPLSTTLIGGTPAITTTEFKIGGIPTVTSCCAFDGSVDEVRVSSAARSPDWVATEYANQSSPSTFYSMGSESATGYERAITIDHTKVPNTDQTSFPVLISGAYPFLATTQYNGQVLNANGYDIVFTSDAAGQHLLPFEIDTYNPATGSAGFWVGIPILSHTTDTTIYMFYGIPNITASQENKAGVWSNGYLSVYHLSNASVGLADSGRAGYTLAGSGSPSAGTGMIGGGAVFNGNPGTYLYHDSVTTYPSGSSPVTLEAWAQMAPGGSGEIAGYGSNSFNGARAALGSDGTNLLLEFENIAIEAPQPANSNWHHMVGVYGGGTLNTMASHLYIDGVPLSPTLIGGTPAITTTEFKIGGTPTVTSCCAFNGSVDEVRVSSVVRSADWVATEYANQSSPSTFYSMGAQNGGQTGGQGGGQGNLICSPSILYTGSNTTCSVGLPSSATAQVTFSLDGQYSVIASPNSLGLFDALINLTSASVGSHTVAFSYPGDGINSAESGSTTVTVETAGTTLPNESMVYQYSITKPDGSSGFAPNGNVLGYFDSINGMWSQIQYDGLNRLISAQVTPPISSTQASSFCWSFDSFGNRTGQSLSNQAFSSSGTQPCQPASGATYSSSQINYASTNQITSGTWQSQQGAFVTGTPAYDPSGNITNDLQNQYLYDAEGRVCAVQIPSVPSLPNQMVQYLYDAEGNRIGKGTITQWSCDTDANGFSLTSEYVLGQGGEQVTEIDGSPNGGKPVHTNAYAGGQLIATYDNLGLHYQLPDWLGTRRLQVSPAGAIEETCQSLPFGDQLNCVQTNLGTGDDSTEHHFTGKERDGESGLDYFGARYYASGMGRFMSPDPLIATPQRLLDPQEWNMYSYVRNNPLSLTDPTGLDIWLKGCGANTDTCNGNYVGTTTDGKFTRTHLFGDNTASATIDEHGNVSYGGGSYQAVWDTNKGEDRNAQLSVSGDLSGFKADVSGSCHTTCVLSGSIVNRDDNGQFSPAQAGDVRKALTGDPNWFANNGDPFHRHDGKNDTSFNSHLPGPAGQASLDVTVPQNPLRGVDFHINSGYPFEDAYQMSRHIFSIGHTGLNGLGSLFGIDPPK